MMSQPCWASSNQLVHSKNSRGMTLLHLAAAQGYAGLIQTLIRWRWVTHKCDTPLCTHRLCQLISLLLSLQHKARRQYWPRAWGGSTQCWPLLLHSTGEWSIFLNAVCSMCLSFCAYVWSMISSGHHRCGHVLWAILRPHWCCTSGTQELWLFLIRWDACRSTSPDPGDTLDWLSSWSSCNRLPKLRANLLTLGWTGGEGNHRPAE